MTQPSRAQLIISLLAMMAWALGQASGSSYLEPPQFYPGCYSGLSWKSAVGDVNLDGRDDVVSSTTNYFSVQLSTPSGNLGPPVVTVIPSCSTCPMNLTQALIGDFNRDGNPDLLFLDGSSVNHPVYIGNGGGLFSFHRNIVFPYPLLVGMSTVDLDQDGYPEVVLHSLEVLSGWSQSVLHVISTAGGNYTHTMKYRPGLGLGQPKFADVNGDGLPDLIALATLPFTTGLPFIRVLQGLGNTSSFGLSWNISLPPVPFLYPYDTGVELVAADFDGNNVADLVVNIWNQAAALQAPTISTCLNPLAGVNWSTMASPGFGSWNFQAKDVNGDGFLDLMGAQNYFTWTGGTPPSYYTGVVRHSRYSVAMGNGTSQFQTPTLFQMPSYPYPASLPALSHIGPINVGDFDGDGDPDLVFHFSGPQWGCVLARNRSRFGTPFSVGSLHSPSITSGTPAVGNSLFSISVTGMPSGASAMLALSLAVNPVASPILIDFSPNNLILPIGSGLTTTNAQGQASVQIPIPPIPALQGSVVFGQWGATNPSSAGGFVLSSGATFIIQ